MIYIKSLKANPKHLDFNIHEIIPHSLNDVVGESNQELLE